MTTRVNPSTSSGSIFARLSNLSLSVKLILAFILVTMLAEIVLAYFSTTTSSQKLTVNAGTNLYASGVAQGTTITNYIDQETINPLITLALNKAVQNSVLTANIRYSGTATGIQAQIQATDQAWTEAEDNDPLIISYITGDIAGQLRQYTNKFPQNTETIITDQYGALVAASHRTTDFYQGDEEWWQKAWNNAQGANYIGQPEYDASTQKYSIIVAVPVHVFNTLGIDVVSGVLRTTLDFNGILNIISGFKLGETGRLDLLLPDGQAVSSDNNLAHPLSAETLAELQSINPDSTYSQINFEGQPSLVSQIPLSAITSKPYMTNLGWKIVIHQDISEALQPVSDALNSTVTIGFIVLILVVLIAVLVSRLITRPIVRLTRTTGQFATGDFTQRADVTGNDEIGTLASGFNTMAAQLQDLVGTLEDRIAHSTRDLQTVADVNAQISTVLDEDRLLQDVVDLTKERFRLYHAHIYLLDSTGQSLALTAGAGHVGRQMVSEVRTIQLSNPQSIVANAARSRKGVIINDVGESKTFLPHPLLPDTESELAVPLIARGQLLGVLDVQSNQVGFFTQDMLSVIELLAGQIAIAISNARLYENAERSSRHERALGTIDRKIQDAVDMDEILQVTVRELGKALRVPYTAIELRLDQPDQENDNQGVLS